MESFMSALNSILDWFKEVGAAARSGPWFSFLGHQVTGQDACLGITVGVLLFVGISLCVIVVRDLLNPQKKD
jgi:hypothetical protein